MKHKQTSLRWITLYLLLFIIMSACISDHEVYGDEPKTVEPLTVNEAMDWYSRSAGMLTKQKSTTDNSVDISYKPFVHLAELFTDELWYAVESSLDFGDSSLMIMTPEVANYADTQGDGIVKQVLKLVVLKNRETGETYSFIMAVVPELDYMLRKGDELEKSSYFSPNSDLDGYVFFFTLSGELINGWFYEDGKVAGSINKPLRGQGTKKLVAVDMEVRSCQGYIGADGAGVECGSSSITVYRDDGNPSFLYPRVGVDIEYPNIYPNTGGGNNNNNSNKPRLPLKPLPLDDSEKNPEKRTDCTDKASQNSQKAQDALGNIAVKSQIESLRINAKTNSATEYGVGISYDPGFGTYSITGGKVWQGTPGTNNTGIGASRYTVFTAHTHYTGLNAAPSCGDVIATVGFYKSAREQGGSYKGTVTFAADGKEYMIYVNDPSALERFYNGFTNSDFYDRGGENGDEFKDKSVWNNAYEAAKEYMKKNGYSENDAQSYALSHVLDQYNTGLKISSRQGATSEFKEQKTVTEGTGKNTKYTPKICP